MKYLKKFENTINNKEYENYLDKTTTDGVFTIGDMVHVKDWDDAKILKVYSVNCLVEFEDGYQTTIKKDELILFTSKEIELYKNSKKYNL